MASMIAAPSFIFFPNVIWHVEVLIRRPFEIAIGDRTFKGLSACCPFVTEYTEDVMTVSTAGPHIVDSRHAVYRYTHDSGVSTQLSCEGVDS